MRGRGRGQDSEQELAEDDADEPHDDRDGQVHHRQVGVVLGPGAADLGTAAGVGSAQPQQLLLELEVLLPQAALALPQLFHFVGRLQKFTVHRVRLGEMDTSISGVEVRPTGIRTKPT